MAEPARVRIFFALWPDENTRESLNSRAWKSTLDNKARRVPACNLHLTLHFIGNVDVDAMDCMRRQARRVSVGSFSVEIDRRGWFRRPRVGWLGPSTIPAALVLLHGALGRALGDCGFDMDSRPFNPHVTVARKLSREPEGPLVEPLHWRIADFALVESVAVDTGVRYRVVETYPLT